jgi:hypothetical protein
MPAITKDKKQLLVSRVRSVLARDAQIELEYLAARLDRDHGLKLNGITCPASQRTSAASGHCAPIERLSTPNSHRSQDSWCPTGHSETCGFHGASKRFQMSAGLFGTES